MNINTNPNLIMMAGYGGQSPQNTTFWYVYMLKCKNDIIYTGCTSNLADRILRHNKGEVTFTKDKLPVKLVTYIAFGDKYKAFDFEKYLKSGSGRAFTKKRLV